MNEIRNIESALATRRQTTTGLHKFLLGQDNDVSLTKSGYVLQNDRNHMMGSLSYAQVGEHVFQYRNHGSYGFGAGAFMKELDGDDFAAIVRPEQRLVLAKLRNKPYALLVPGTFQQAIALVFGRSVQEECEQDRDWHPLDLMSPPPDASWRELGHALVMVPSYTQRVYSFFATVMDIGNGAAELLLHSLWKLTAQCFWHACISLGWKKGCGRAIGNVDWLGSGRFVVLFFEAKGAGRQKRS